MDIFEQLVPGLGWPSGNPGSVGSRETPYISLLQNLTDDAIASLYVTKFSKISLYLNKLYVTYCRALQHTVESSVTYIAKSAHNLSNSALTCTYIHTLTAHTYSSQFLVVSQPWKRCWDWFLTVIAMLFIHCAAFWNKRNTQKWS